MNTADVVTVCRTVVELAVIGAGLKVALVVLPRPKVTTPRQTQARKTGASAAATTSTSAATEPESPEGSR